MTIAFGILLALIGLALWTYAGLLPVARILSSEQGVADLDMTTTWMGVITIARRTVPGVRAIRVATDRDVIEVKRDDGWQDLAIRFTRDATALGQFVALLQHYLKAGGPSVLALPLRGRKGMMTRFIALFPLGTIALYSGIVLIAGLGS